MQVLEGPGPSFIYWALKRPQRSPGLSCKYWALKRPRSITVSEVKLNKIKCFVAISLYCIADQYLAPD